MATNLGVSEAAGSVGSSSSAGKAAPRTAKEYSSFLVRWWRLRGDERRLEIEHIQSGQRTRVDSVAAALEWMNAHDRTPPKAPQPKRTAGLPAPDHKEEDR